MIYLSRLQASIIKSSDYRQWRQYGVAFGIREGTYDVPNKTLASGHVFNVVSHVVLFKCNIFGVRRPNVYDKTSGV